MASKGMTWDAAADRKLLLGILQMQNVAVDYAAMSNYMTSDEQNCTVEAVKGRVKKLKAMAKEGSASEEDAATTPSTNSNARKRKAASEPNEGMPAKKTKTPKKKGGKTVQATQSNDEDGESGDELGGVSVKEEGRED